MDDINSIFINTNKKRGRKPKIKNDDFKTEEVKIPKKRGRKPTGKIYELNKINTSMVVNTTNCILAHLPLTDKDINKLMNKYTDDEQILSDSITETKSLQVQVQVQSQVPVQNSFIIDVDEDLRNKYSDRCLELDNLRKNYTDLLEKHKKFAYLEDKISDLGTIEKKYFVNNTNLYDTCGNCWKDESENCCWWCCSEFNTVPIGLPNKYINKQFYLHGCFCSFNCAHAYNLDLNDYKVWERYSLLNYIKKIIFNDSNVQSIIAAPPRQILKKFGGIMDVNDFRSASIFIPKEYVYMLPPMIPIFTVIEEIPKFFYKGKGDKKKTEFTELKLKRTKPILTQCNSLLDLFK
jgi:hypothetical protein